MLHWLSPFSGGDLDCHMCLGTHVHTALRRSPCQSQGFLPLRIGTAAGHVRRAPSLVILPAVRAKVHHQLRHRDGACRRANLRGCLTPCTGEFPRAAPQNHLVSLENKSDIPGTDSRGLQNSWKMHTMKKTMQVSKTFDKNKHLLNFLFNEHVGFPLCVHSSQRIIAIPRPQPF